MKLDRLDLLTALAIGTAAIGLALAVYVVVDDQVQRRRMAGRWARLDQALADAEENGAARELRGVAGDPTA